MNEPTVNYRYTLACRAWTIVGGYKSYDEHLTDYYYGGQSDTSPQARAGLESTNFPHVWQPGVNTARCMLAQRSAGGENCETYTYRESYYSEVTMHDADEKGFTVTPHPPNALCNCGFYSMKRFVYGLCADYGGNVLGIIRVWGKAIDCENGWRTQFAQPVLLVTFVNTPLLPAKRAAARYGTGIVNINDLVEKRIIDEEGYMIRPESEWEV